MKIFYLTGDATKPIDIDGGTKIIVHVCNNEGKWGRGFVLALSKKWEKPEQDYLSNPALNLGDVQFVQVERDLYVANMVAQRSLRSKNNPVPLVYSSLQECLIKVAEFAKETKATVHGPRFGAGLAGGDWNKTEYIIEDTLIRESIPVYIYNPPLQKLP